MIYDTSLENTSNNMKKLFGFFDIDKRNDDDNIWKGFPVEKWVVKKLKLMRMFVI